MALTAISIDLHSVVQHLILYSYAHHSMLLAIQLLKPLYLTLVEDIVGYMFDGQLYDIFDLMIHPIISSLAMSSSRPIVMNKCLV
mmetsp:Transcript_34744/g.83966  ORF Transcript_34744/g.83966 Transcript_34744/m.83966 type:complete len:85 (-) Transcript_34744:686-940(-)